MNNAIYGDMILSFPEQERKFFYFDMAPKLNDGYENITDGVPMYGILHAEKSSAKDSNGNWVREDKQTVWSRKPLQSGKFVMFDRVVYRILTDQDWPTQGGFYVYGIEKVIGSNGQATVDPQANLGGRSFQ